VAKTDIGIEIEIAVSDEQILATYGVMSQLRPHLQAAEYVGIVRMQQAESGYKLAALKENGRVTSVAGFRISHSLATGKYLYLDDLVTDQDRRSQGAGRVLFHWLVLQARNGQCRVLHRLLPFLPETFAGRKWLTGLANAGTDLCIVESGVAACGPEGPRHEVPGYDRAVPPGRKPF
jgi:GNAT superfamily N-acetyltransferase